MRIIKTLSYYAVVILNFILIAFLGSLSTITTFGYNIKLWPQGLAILIAYTATTLVLLHQNKLFKPFNYYYKTNNIVLVIFKIIYLIYLIHPIFLTIYLLGTPLTNYLGSQVTTILEIGPFLKFDRIFIFPNMIVVIDSEKYKHITCLLYDTPEKRVALFERILNNGSNKKPFETMESLLQYEILEFQKKAQESKENSWLGFLSFISLEASKIFIKFYNIFKLSFLATNGYFVYKTAAYFLLPTNFTPIMFANTGLETVSMDLVNPGTFDSGRLAIERFIYLSEENNYLLRDLHNSARQNYRFQSQLITMSLLGSSQILTNLMLNFLDANARYIIEYHTLCNSTLLLSGETNISLYNSVVSENLKFLETMQFMLETRLKVSINEKNGIYSSVIIESTESFRLFNSPKTFNVEKSVEVLNLEFRMHISRASIPRSS
jgi:hypothetical protein